MRKIIGLFVVFVVLVTAAPAEDRGMPTSSSEAVAVLDKAREAMKSLKAVRYRAEYRPTGWLTAWVPEISATVLLAGQSSWKIDRFHFDGTVQPPKADKAQKVVAGCDGDTYFLVHDESKTVYEDIDPAVLGASGRSIPRAVLSAFTSGDPLSDERDAKQIELGETTTVSGELCDQVIVTLRDDRQTIWYIARKDHLPRRVDRVFTNPTEGRGTTELLIGNLELNPAVGHDAFKTVVPEGYARSDQFAP